MEAAEGARWENGALLFRYADRARDLTGVRVLASTFKDDLSLHDRIWELRRERPPVQRVEYRFELTHRDGTRETVCDPANPHRAPGGFGESSVLEHPDYRPPDWFGLPADGGKWQSGDLPVRRLGTTLDIRVWSPGTETGRVLVAHDGPDYDRFGGLGHYTAAMVEAGRVPPYHLVLLPAGDRLEWYSADPAYSLALAGEIVPHLRAELGADRVVGAGASLGALAMLHAQRRHPAGFAGLFLQSGSYFQPRHDSQESGFEHWARIIRFTSRTLKARRGPAVPVALTCGAGEENLANNRDMADALDDQGYAVTFAENPDAHTWVGWRDTFDPHLTGLLRRVWPD
ncbi:alpha/beta hydrolase-fold protein [Actinoplanes sp. NPDC051861]|uniref:alpha/beta hydrolase n=1 Tax=Actinoplanes sp. NPDC051861 TaxID=3155170 RepID=UPI003442F930